MDLAHILNGLSNAEPAAWLTVLLAIYFSENRRAARLRMPSSAMSKGDETPPDYRALRVLVVLKALGSFIYPLLVGFSSPFGPSTTGVLRTYEVVAWTIYLLSTFCIYFVMAALLRRSFQPLPGLSTAALIVFRYAAVLAIGIALTAHLPAFSPHHLTAWVDEVSFSFMACVCAFEVTLLIMLIAQLGRLGMFVFSRPIGIAFGLALLGSLDLMQALTSKLSPNVVQRVGLLYELGVYIAAFTWTFYILRTEPKRMPHSLSPASRLMKWNEIAMKLELAGKQAEHVPFISGVESIVDSILKRSESRAD